MTLIVISKCEKTEFTDLEDAEDFALKTGL